MRSMMKFLIFIFVFALVSFFDSSVNALDNKVIEDGTYIITSKLNNSSVVQSVSSNGRNGTNVNISIDKSLQNQFWNISYLGDGYYKISAYTNDNLLLDVSEAKAANGTNVQLWENNGNNAQKWKIKNNNDGSYSFISALGNFYLDVSEAKTNDNTNVQIYKGNGNNAQKFVLSKIDLSTIDEGPYNLASLLDQNMYVGINSGVASNNVNVALYNHSDDNGLKWYFYNIKDNIYEVRSLLNPNYNLDVSEANMNNAGNVQLWQNNGNNAQRWRIVKFDGGFIRLSNVNSGKNLDVSGANKSNGTNIQQWQNNGNNAQKFKLIDTATSNYDQVLDDATYIFCSALNLNKAIKGNSNVVLYDVDGNTNEMITTEYVGDGFYKLKVKDNVLTNNNGNVILSEDKNADNQMWFVFETDGYYTFISKTNGKALDVSEAKTNNNTNIQTWTSTGHKAQKFKLLKVDTTPIAKYYYNIASVLDQSMYVGINSGVEAYNVNVALYSQNDTNDLKWYIENVSDNVYEVKSVLNQKYYLDVLEAKKNNGGNVQLWQNNGNNAQRWRIVKFDDGTYQIFNVNSGKNLDVSGADKGNGTNIQQWEPNGNNAQKFKLLKTTKSSYEQVLSNGEYLFYSALNLNKTVRGNANTVLYDVEGSVSEIITTEYLSDGFYTLKVNGKALTNNNGNVVTANYTGSDNQQWYVLKNGEYYTFISKTDGKALDVSEAKTNNNTNIQTWPLTYHNAQKYRLEGVKDTILKNGYYNIVFDDNALGITSEIPYNGSTISLQNNTNSNQQKWEFKQIKNNLFEIRSVLNPNKLLDVKGANRANGTFVQTYAANGNNAQRWYVVALENGGYKLISSLSHTFLTINNGVRIYSNDFSDKQIFDLQESDGNAFGKTVEENYYVIRSGLNNNMVLDVSGGSMRSGTNVQLYSYLTLASQIWKFNYLGDGLYSIVSAMNPKRALTNLNNNVVISQYNGADNQKWYVKMLENNMISIISASNSLYVDVKGAKTANSTNIQMFQSNGNTAQKYSLDYYGGTKTFRGIDISKYQGNIDWDKLAGTDINFVIMRAGYGMFENQKDEKFDTYYSGATWYDIPIGVYTFSYAKSESDAYQEAVMTLKWLNGRHLDLPVFYDLEHSSQVYLGKEKLTNMAITFCNHILSNGYQCGIYANKNWLTNYLDAYKLAGLYPIWLAHYTGPDDFNTVYNNLNRYSSSYDITSYKFWQFSSLGRYYGITDNTVDLD
ncbi:MAG: RICIN domain-containing protein, partial [Bacilli bacterium]|nr:RICIN domain-containing protein [Bacilli bacterium]